MRGSGRALAVSLALHLVPLCAVQWPRATASATWKPLRAPLTLAWSTAPPSRPTVDVSAPAPDLPPRQVEVRRRRTIHIPGDREPAPPEPGPYGPEPELIARPPSVAPVFSAPPEMPPHPVVEVLRQSTLSGARTVAGPRGEVRVYFLQAGESASAALALAGSPLVLVSADDVVPTGGDLDWFEAGAETSWLRRPETVRSWWSLWGTVAPRVGRRDGQVVAIWLPASVRAGWESEAAGALALWDNLIASPDLAGWVPGG